MKVITPVSSELLDEARSAYRKLDEKHEKLRKAAIRLRLAQKEYAHNTCEDNAWLVGKAAHELDKVLAE